MQTQKNLLSCYSKSKRSICSNADICRSSKKKNTSNMYLSKPYSVFAIYIPIISVIGYYHIPFCECFWHEDSCIKSLSVPKDECKKKKSPTLQAEEGPPCPPRARTTCGRRIGSVCCRPEQCPSARCIWRPGPPRRRTHGWWGTFFCWRGRETVNTTTTQTHANHFRWEVNIYSNLGSK